MIAVRLVCVLFLVLGLAMLWVALGEHRDRKAFVEGASAAPGEVIKVTELRGSGRRSSSRYSYKLRFPGPRGDPVDAMATKTSNSPRFAEGEQVPVLFSRDDFHNAEIDDWRQLWGDAVAAFVIAAGLLAAGSIGWFFTYGQYDLDARSKRIAITFTASFLLAGGTCFALFATWPVQVIVGSALLYFGYHAVRARRAHLAQLPTFIAPRKKREKKKR